MIRDRKPDSLHLPFKEASAYLGFLNYSLTINPRGEPPFIQIRALCAPCATSWGQLPRRGFLFLQHTTLTIRERRQITLLEEQYRYNNTFKEKQKDLTFLLLCEVNIPSIGCATSRQAPAFFLPSAFFA